MTEPGSNPAQYADTGPLSDGELQQFRDVLFRASGLSWPRSGLRASAIALLARLDEKEAQLEQVKLTAGVR